MLNYILIYFVIGLLFYTICRILTELSLLKCMEVPNDLGLGTVFCWPVMMFTMFAYYIQEIKVFTLLNNTVSFIPELITKIVVSKIKGRKNEDKNV